MLHNYFFYFVVVFSLLLEVGVQGFSTNVGSHSRVCFFEKLKKKDKMGISFQVENGGKLDIDLDIYAPSGEVLHSERKQYAGGYNFIAEEEGRYEYCFFNEKSTKNDKKISFSVTGSPYFSTLTPKGSKESDHLTPLDQEIAGLNNQLRAIKDDQFYIITRERLHRDTAESTNSRVLWWSIFQLLVLVGVCYWQTNYLKQFFEVKRVI